MKTRMLGVLALGLVTAACGVTQEERVTGGAAAGAATGAGVGALGGPPGVLAGAAIGAGAGAATGALTEPSTVNLGEPPWSNPDARVPGVTRGGTARSGAGGGSGMASAQVRDLQRALNNRGYNAGPADGIYGARTRQAVQSWQRANNMEATGRPTPQMMANLGLGDSATGSTDPNRAYMGGGSVGGGGGGGAVQSRGPGDNLQDRVLRPGMEPDPNSGQDVSSGGSDGSSGGGAQGTTR